MKKFDKNFTLLSFGATQSSTYSVLNVRFRVRAKPGKHSSVTYCLFNKDSMLRAYGGFILKLQVLPKIVHASFAALMSHHEVLQRIMQFVYFVDVLLALEPSCKLWQSISNQEWYWKMAIKTRFKNSDQLLKEINALAFLSTTSSTKKHAYAIFKHGCYGCGSRSNQELRGTYITIKCCCNMISKQAALKEFKLPRELFKEHFPKFTPTKTVCAFSLAYLQKRVQREGERENQMSSDTSVAAVQVIDLTNEAPITSNYQTRKAEFLTLLNQLPYSRYSYELKPVLYKLRSNVNVKSIADQLYEYTFFRANGAYETLDDEQSVRYFMHKFQSEEGISPHIYVPHQWQSFASTCDTSRQAMAPILANLGRKVQVKLFVPNIATDMLLLQEYSITLDHAWQYIITGEAPDWDKIKQEVQELAERMETTGYHVVERNLRKRKVMFPDDENAPKAKKPRKQK